MSKLGAKNILMLLGVLLFIVTAGYGIIYWRSNKTKLSDGTSDPKQSQPTTLVGSWTLRSVNGQKPTGQAGKLIFESSSVVKAQFCNSMAGTYKLENDILKMNLTSTLMACDDQLLMETERILSTFGTNGARIEKVGSGGVEPELRLFDPSSDSDSPVLIFYEPQDG